MVMKLTHTCTGSYSCQQKKVEVVGTSSSMPLASMSVHTSLSAPVMSAKEGSRQTSTSSIVMCA